MARLPPSCHAVYRGLRIPDLRAGDDSPLRTSHRHVLPATCRFRRLPTQRLRPCGLNATLRTQSQPSADVSSSRSSRRYHDAPAARRQSSEKRRVQICDAVVLGGAPSTPLKPRRPLLQKCGDAFQEIRAPADLALQIAFEVELSLEIVQPAGTHRLLDQPEGGARAGGETPDRKHDLAQELRVGVDLVD